MSKPNWSRASIDLDALLTRKIQDAAGRQIRLVRRGDRLDCRTHTACFCWWVSELDGDINETEG